MRSLAYISSLSICHRDIKPQNLLVDPSNHVLKLCDFGSSKQLVAGEANVAYICSRFYRAPELIFGATDYTTAVGAWAHAWAPWFSRLAYVWGRGATDIWSAGCVCAELLLGTPLFPGESGVDQLVEIIKVRRSCGRGVVCVRRWWLRCFDCCARHGVFAATHVLRTLLLAHAHATRTAARVSQVLGTPTREDIRSMNCSYADFKFPQIKSHPWNKVLRRAPAEAIDFVSRLLVYTPSQRLTPLEAMAHPVFDELRYPGARLPNGKPLPPLFNFTKQGG